MFQQAAQAYVNGPYTCSSSPNVQTSSEPNLIKLMERLNCEINYSLWCDFNYVTVHIKSFQWKKAYSVDHKLIKTRQKLIFFKVFSFEFRLINFFYHLYSAYFNLRLTFILITADRIDRSLICCSLFQNVCGEPAPWTWTETVVAFKRETCWLG